MIYLKYIINEAGKNIHLHNMMPSELQQLLQWSKHKDRLYADYDFPQFNNKELADWYSIKTRKNRMLVSICSQDGELLGYISLRNIKKFFKISELGIVLNPARIEKGYGTDAIKTFLRWYFQTLKYNKLLLSVAMYNDRAHFVYKKIGFVEKYTFYDIFENTEIDPLNDPEYINIKKFFKNKRGLIYVNCLKMEISTYSTD